MAEYKTVADAMKAVDIAVEDTIKDQPQLKEYEDDVYHDMVLAIALDCDDAVVLELSRRTGIPIS